MKTALLKWRELVAACPTWQLLCNRTDAEPEDNAAAAATFIHLWGWTAHPGHPFMAIETDMFARDLRATTSMPASGVVIFRMEIGRITEIPIDEEYEAMEGWIEDLINEIGELQGTGEYMSVSRVEVEEDVVTDEKEAIQAWAFLGRAYWPAEG